MNSNITQKLELFASNVQEVKKEFIWHDMITKRLAALMYSLDNKKINCEEIKNSRELIKSQAGAFSMFRGSSNLCIATLLSLSDNQHELFSNTLSVYDMLKKVKLSSSDFLAISAYQIAAHGNSEQYWQIVERTRAFYDGMKANHYFLTGADDYIFAAMLGLSDTDVNDGVIKIEQIFTQLKSEFWATNSVQTLAQVLTLCKNSDETLSRILILRDALKNRGLKLDKTYTLPSLGILALLSSDIDSVVTDVWEAQFFLREQKGFGVLSVSTQELLMFSSAIAASAYSENLNDNILTASLATTVTNIIIAQQAAMLAAASSAAAASVAASSN